MYFLQLACILAIAPVALAQKYGSSSPTAAALASTASPRAFTINVGNYGLTFSPANITAAVGSTIEFLFSPDQHSVAQAAFNKPCTPLGGAGFFSGQVRTYTSLVPNSFTIVVADTNPIWFYCATYEHCRNGMVGVVNARVGGNETLEMFVAAAKNATQNVAPTVIQGGTLVSPTPHVLGPAATTSKSAGAVNKTYVGMWNIIAVFGTVLIGFVVGALLL